MDAINKDERLTEVGREFASVLRKEYYNWSAEQLINKALALQGLLARYLDEELSKLLSPQSVEEIMEKLKLLISPEFSTLSQEQQDLYSALFESDIAAENAMEIVQSKPADAALLAKAFNGTLTVDDLR